MKTGYCNSRKAGHNRTHITTEYKCVDVALRPDLWSQAGKIKAEMRRRDYYNVCEFCKDFEPDPE